MRKTPSQRAFPLLPEVLSGETADIYFLRAKEVLAAKGIDRVVGMEVFPGRPGIFCGSEQVSQLLADVGFKGELWALDEGEPVEAREAALEIFDHYSSFGVYETAILGILASCSAWATAAREVVEAAGGAPVISFGARHVHPNVAGIMDYSAIVGGCATGSTPLGAALAGKDPSGTMPHAMILIFGDTLRAAKAFSATVPEDVPRIVLVDTFQDEAIESVRVAEAMGGALDGVRLDTPSERGGVTPALVKEVRARLDLADFTEVRVVVSGGVTPERIRAFREDSAPVDGYGVGSHISGAVPIDYTADIREIEGKPVAKRGRIPGMSRSERLRRLL
jgi:nicotinate phosphoribosyltransferase